MQFNYFMYDYYFRNKIYWIFKFFNIFKKFAGKAGRGGGERGEKLNFNRPKSCRKTSKLFFWIVKKLQKQVN